MNGDEDDVWFFYAVMVQKLNPAAAKLLRSISTNDLNDPAAFARKWAETFRNKPPASR